MNQEEKQRQQAGPPLRYDNTLRVLFLQCPRKFYWWKIRQVDQLVRPPYFAFGSAWHLIKGTWYTTLSHNPSLVPLSDEWRFEGLRALSAGLNFWDNSGAQPTKHDNRDNLASMWSAYLGQYPTEPWQLIKGGSELGWLWPLPSAGGAHTAYFLGGSMDGYIEWPGYGQMCLEEKTTSIWLSDQYILQWRFSSQITGYIWYLANLLGTSRVHGAVISMATKQTPAKSGATPRFSRIIETRTEEDFLEFERDWRTTIDHITRCWDNWHWPKTTDTINCVGGIGKSACPYKGLCLSGLPPHLISHTSFPNLTLREQWEPWKRQQELILPTRQNRTIESFAPTFLRDSNGKLRPLIF